MKTKTNLYLFLIALISAMGGFLFGYDWVVIGGAKPFYEQYFQIANSPTMQGWAMSSALIGCLIGALSAGKLSDRLGRKPILIVAAGLFICTAIGTGAANSFGWFNVFRLIGGFAIGIASSLSPMYIAEIAPAHLRGRFVSINQLTVVLGILSAQIVNWQIAEPVADPCHSRNDPSVMERANGMAVDVLGHDRTRCAVLLLQFRVARKPALVSFVGI